MPSVKNLIAILSYSLFMVVNVAHAETVYVDPGEVGANARDFTFSAGPAASVDIRWADSKTLEYTDGVHLFFLYGPPCQAFAGILLDAAGNEIPDSELAGKSICTAGSDLSAGVIELPSATVFSGIRLVSGGFASEYAWQWTWEEDEKPVVGQIEASGNQPPVPDAGGRYEGVAGVPVTFDASGSSDPDGSITTYTWDFGDNTSLGGESIQHTYDNGGIYNVILTVTDDEGISASTSTVADIGNNSLRPVADDGGPYVGEALTNVAFDGTGSADPDGSISDYAWDFGDGSPVIMGTATPLHIYAEAGSYFVVLTVTDDTGETDSTVTLASIVSGDSAPEADAGPPVEGVAGTSVSFDGSNSSDVDGPIAQYAWDFGDNSPVDTVSGPNPSYTYAAPGDYTVVLTVTDSDGVKDSDSTAASIDSNPLPPRADAGVPAEGATGVAVSFDGSGSVDSDGSIVTYAWDFGDGSPVDTLSGANPDHTYSVADNYTVTLTVTDDDGLMDMDTTQAAIDQANSPPTSVAGGPYSGLVSTPVLFAASGSSDSDGSIVQYEWDFGDGSFGSGLFVAYNYSTPGSYTAKLTVTDDSGDSDESNAVVVIGGGAIQPPMVFTTGPYSGVAGVPLTLDGSDSSDQDGTINLYAWTFGDGNSGNGPMPMNTYATSGAYAVNLQVTDDDGFTSSSGTIARIGDLSLLPNAVASPNAVGVVDNQQDRGVVDSPLYNGVVAVPIGFNGGDSDDLDGTIDRYDWAFGDGFVANDAGSTPSHAYVDAGEYIARLTVTDDSGQIDTDVAVVEVGIGNLPPVARAGLIVMGQAGEEITFDAASSTDSNGNIVRYDWSFGDGIALDDGGATPSHAYVSAGTYYVTVEVTDNDGAVSSAVTLAEIDSGGKKDDDDDDWYDCFIATAAYGSYLEPEVEILRQFRDKRLLTNAPGKAFVDWYYRTSPPIADAIAENDGLRFFVRAVLTPLVYAIKHPMATTSGMLLLLLGCIAWRRQTSAPIS